MKYKVRISATALAEVDEASAYIARRSPLNAQRWLSAMLEKIEALAEFPNRCAKMPDNKYVNEELRHLIFKSHRVIFRVEEDTHTVRVLALRHGARRFIGQEPDQAPDDLEDD